MADPKDMHSTGRGGAGNIGKGEGIYTDGDIVREGPAGESGRPGLPDYSAGRGGTGNIVHDSRTGTAMAKEGSIPAPSSDYVPEVATKEGHYADYHTGRGGEGNIHRDKYGGHSKPQKEHKELEAKGAAEHKGVLAKAKNALAHADKHKGENGS